MERVVLLTHGKVSVAAGPLEESLAILRKRGMTVSVPQNEWDKHGDILASAGNVRLALTPEDLADAELCLVLGGDGTMLRAFHLTRDLAIPVAGVNLGRVGFLTTILPEDLVIGLHRLLDGDFVEYPLLGLEASIGAETFRATNDVAVSKGDRSRVCSLALTINGVTLFEVLCDGVIAATPAGSSAYSLAAGGPLLGISVQAYVISLVAPHLVGVRPVVAAPGDVLEIINTEEELDCYIDVDGQRSATLTPGAILRVRATPAMTSLALLGGDSLYHHFRDRLL
ncbi:MAG TPA: NAD(+)/NADH kinase [Thermoleophilia bacterium]|nr:NAD(+)/NADH kinase [Thermoleophilia bacterium]